MKNNKRKPGKGFNLLTLLPYVIVIAMIFMLFNGSSSNVKNIPYNKFKEDAAHMQFNNVDMEMDGLVINVTGSYKKKVSPKQQQQIIDKAKSINKNLSKEELAKIEKESAYQKIKFSTVIPRSEENIAWLTKVLTDNQKNAKKVDVSVPTDNSMWLNLLFSFLPLALLMAMMWFGMRQMGGGPNKAFEIGKSTARMETNVKTRFKDVAGCEEEKEEVKELIDYLKQPKKYTDMGAHIPKGLLMVGPPGTGKTLLAKALAGEAHVPFFSISGSDFVEMFVGAGASRVRDLFKKAKQVEPCIIFIDEIDAVGRQRGAGMGGGNDEREQTLNQLLVEMDGMDDNNGIIVIAATNRPDVLDPALLRSGRFDRRVTVDLPDKKGRTQILEVHARNKHLAPDINLANLAARTPGFSGADLANVLNEAAILAVRENRKEIHMDDLDEAVDRVMMGPAKKSKKYTEDDKKLVSYHEAGHAVIGIKLKDADMVQKVTIIPRGEAGGYNLMTPREERYFNRKNELMAKIIGLLGGRTAEEIVFNEISAGAVNDIEQITKIAKNMVRVYGMSSLGPIQYADPQGNVFLGRDYNNGSNYSGEIAFEIDKEVRRIVDECHARCREILEENRDLLDLIAKSLMSEETLTKEQIDNLVKYGKLEKPEEEMKDEEEKA